MDKFTTIEDVKNIVKNFCDERDWEQFHNAKDLAIGISTEANELLQIFRFKSEDEIKNILKTSKKISLKKNWRMFYISFCVLRK